MTQAGTRSPRAALPKRSAIFVCLAWTVLATACAHPRVTTPTAAATAGISIALYQGTTPELSYGVVDDRRWIELGSHELVLDHIEPGASLASLVIEPLGPELGTPLAIERCVREALRSVSAPVAVPGPPHAMTRDELVRARIAALGVAEGEPIAPSKPAATSRGARRTIAVAPIVRCTASGTPGKRLVRILYVSYSLAYTAQHDLAMTAPDHAELATRFTFVTPNWREHADVVVFDGAPGGEHPPTELVRGRVSLDGSTAILAIKLRDVPAHLVRIYDGAIATPETDASDVSWNAESIHLVWVWIELARTALSPGPIHARIALPDEAVRELELPATLRAPQLGADVRLPLWPDDMLSGTRLRLSDSDGSSQLSERLILSISNLGDVARDVWVEEHARKARRRKLERAWPRRPLVNAAADGDVVRQKLEVKPHAIERAGYTFTYEF